tara:strand:+ start:418 stop:789 length:372 start_codon:yes stop_codon:yes gene_type:complete
MNDLVELTRQKLNDDPDDVETEVLNEIISLRTGMIGAGLAKTKQYANQIDSQVRKLKGTASSLKSAKTPQDTNKSLADALGTIGNLFFLQRKMSMYLALTTAATGFDSDKQSKILKKLEKGKR